MVMSQVKLASRGAVAWLDPAELDADFPALAELAKRLRGLPEAFAQAAAAKPDARPVRPLLEPALPIEWEPCAALAPPSKGPQLLVLDPDHVVDNNLFLCDGDRRRREAAHLGACISSTAATRARICWIRTRRRSRPKQWEATWF